MNLNKETRTSGRQPVERKVRRRHTRSAVLPESPEITARLASNLLRTVSHDIRNPITTIRGFAKMVLDGRTGPISDSQRECLQIAFNGVDQLLGTVASVNVASNLITKIQPEILNFHALFQQAVSSFHSRLSAKAVTVEEHIENDTAMICGDRRALAHVIERLLSCAIRNIEYGGKLQVNLRCRNEMTLLLALPNVLSLAGVDEELAAIREIVFLHGGKIASQDGKDTQTLSLTLPGDQWSQSTS